MRVVSLGECMLEVKIQNYPQALFGFGGDTFNTAYYLTLLGIDCAYATALGTDKQSQWLLEQWNSLGIDTRLVRQIPDKSPGIYTIQTDRQGERSFNYWRENSAARSLLNDFDLAVWLQHFEEVKLFYLSLISVAVLAEQGRDNLLILLAALQEREVHIAFDNNYRPALWQDAQQALFWQQQILPFVDTYLPSLEDEASLYSLNKADHEALVQHFHALAVANIVIKNGAQSCTILWEGHSKTLPTKNLMPVDSTAAGDSFNAGFLAAKLRGYDGEKAVKVGHDLASQVIMQPGALVAKNNLELALFP
ncbi:MAG: sugar kinase [Oceanospirillaceae bacterium]